MASPSSRHVLLRQGGSFLIIGALQLLVDWALFVALTALGVAAAPANLASRVGGALLGFWLNGRVTFASEVPHAWAGGASPSSCWCGCH